MGKIDYAFKAKVLSENQDALSLQRALSLIEFKGDCFEDAYKETIGKGVSSFFTNNENADLIWKECERINRSYYYRVKRLKRNITAMLLKGTCFFITLTFTDETLASTTAETRRRYVTRFLKSQSDTYCANIDFGSKNNREHYHAIILSEKVDFTTWDKYGFSNGKKIKNDCNDTVKLAKYISKLTNHAIKDTTKGSRAIYSA